MPLPIHNDTLQTVCSAKRQRFVCVLFDNLQLWLAALRNRNKEIFENSTRFFNFACCPFHPLVDLCTYISLDDLNIMVQQYAWEFELCCHLCKQYINQNSTQIFLSWKLRIWKLSVTYNKYSKHIVYIRIKGTVSVILSDPPFKKGACTIHNTQKSEILAVFSQFANFDFNYSLLVRLYPGYTGPQGVS